MDRAIAILATFITITAIPGGGALLLGFEDFPTVWLRGTPFRDFTVPAAALTGAVGGSALVAAILGFVRSRWAGWAGLVAGAMMLGYIAGGLILLNDGAAWPHWIEWLYLAVGGLLAGVGLAIVLGLGVRYEVVYRADQ